MKNTVKKWKVIGSIVGAVTVATTAIAVPLVCIKHSPTKQIDSIKPASDSQSFGQGQILLNGSTQAPTVTYGYNAFQLTINNNVADLPDNASITYTLEGTPSNITLSNNILTVSAGLDVGAHNFTLSCTMRHAGYTTNTISNDFTLTVSNTPFPQNGQILINNGTTIPQCMYGITSQFDLTYSNSVAGATYTFSIDNAPTGVSIVANNKLNVANTTNAGQYPLTIKCEATKTGYETTTYVGTFTLIVNQQTIDSGNLNFEFDGDSTPANITYSTDETEVTTYPLTIDGLPAGSDSDLDINYAILSTDTHFQIDGSNLKVVNKPSTPSNSTFLAIGTYNITLTATITSTSGNYALVTFNRTVTINVVADATPSATLTVDSSLLTAHPNYFTNKGTAVYYSGTSGITVYNQMLDLYQYVQQYGDLTATTLTINISGTIDYGIIVDTRLSTLPNDNARTLVINGSGNISINKSINDSNGQAEVGILIGSRSTNPVQWSGNLTIAVPITVASADVVFAEGTVAIYGLYCYRNLGTILLNGNINVTSTGLGYIRAVCIDQLWLYSILQITGTISATSTNIAMACYVGQIYQTATFNSTGTYNATNNVDRLTNGDAYGVWFQNDMGGTFNMTGGAVSVSSKSNQASSGIRFNGTTTGTVNIETTGTITVNTYVDTTKLNYSSESDGIYFAGAINGTATINIGQTTNKPKFILTAGGPSYCIRFAARTSSTSVIKINTNTATNQVSTIVSKSSNAYAVLFSAISDANVTVAGNWSCQSEGGVSLGVTFDGQVSGTVTIDNVNFRINANMANAYAVRFNNIVNQCTINIKMAAVIYAHGSSLSPTGVLFGNNVLSGTTINISSAITVFGDIYSSTQVYGTASAIYFAANIMKGAAINLTNNLINIRSLSLARAFWFGDAAGEAVSGNFTITGNAVSIETRQADIVNPTSGFLFVWASAQDSVFTINTNSFLVNSNSATANGACYFIWANAPNYLQGSWTVQNTNKCYSNKPFNAGTTNDYITGYNYTLPWNGTNCTEGTASTTSNDASEVVGIAQTRGSTYAISDTNAPAFTDASTYFWVIGMTASGGTSTNALRNEFNTVVRNRMSGLLTTLGNTPTDAVWLAIANCPLVTT